MAITVIGVSLRIRGNTMFKLRPLALVAGFTIAAGFGHASSAQNGSAGDWTQPVTPWGDPDLQGMWPVYHLISVPLERPEAFGNRLHFNEEEMAEQEARLQARNQRYEEEHASDRIGMGHWAEESELPVQTSLIVSPEDGQLPEMTEEGKRRAALMGSSWTQEHYDSVADFDTWDRCITRGLPPSMFPFQYNNGIQIMQTPGYVVIRLEMIHETRIIPLENYPQVDEGVKQWLGVSRGHWEGDTLVIETTNFNGEAGMINFGTPGTPRANMPSSTEMKITERLERVSEDQINYSITIEDPVVLESSWTAAFPWQRDPGYEFFEYACNEDNYAIRDFITTSRFQRAQEAGGE